MVQRLLFLRYGLIVIISILLAYFFYNYNTSCSKLNCISFDIKKYFQLKEVYTDNATTFRALYQNNESLLRVEIINNQNLETAKKTITLKILRMNALFEDAAAPYPGEISDRIHCDDKYKPTFDTIQNKNLPISFFKAYLNDRMTYGACTDIQTVYRSILALFYCNNQNKMYELEFIAPKKYFESNENKFVLTLKTLNCN